MGIKNTSQAATESLFGVVPRNSFRPKPDRHQYICVQALPEPDKVKVYFCIACVTIISTITDNQGSHQGPVYVFVVNHNFLVSITNVSELI